MRVESPIRLSASKEITFTHGTARDAPVSILGPLNPTSMCCSHGTFPHFSPQNSHLSIYYYHQDLHSRPFYRGSLVGGELGNDTPQHSSTRQ
ncbi:hypothetical protein DL98DRAFT_461316 [Cadophora sp. DSE1049]|nr:hypothetical protein DL98DRAFT_461316 [Cadophora sp. DSE1049]